MEIRKDILVGDDGDLLVGSDGDLVIGPSSDQHVEDILVATPGEYKQYPLLGAAIIQAKNGALSGEMKNKIRINLESDGYRLTQIDNEDSETVDEFILNIDYTER